MESELSINCRANGFYSDQMKTRKDQFI